MSCWQSSRAAGEALDADVIRATMPSLRISGGAAALGLLAGLSPNPDGVKKQTPTS